MASEVRADFDALSKDVAENYAYFDSRLTNWAGVPGLYQGELAKVKTREDFIGVLERVLDELCDAHAQLTVNTARSPRLVPSGADIWAEWIGGKAIVLEVREDSDARRAGIRAGAEVLALDDVPIGEAVKSRIGRSLTRIDDAVRSWALRAALAGRHNQERRLWLRQGGSELRATLPAADQFTSRVNRITARTLQDNVGDIRFHDSLGDSRVVVEFDLALAQLGTVRGLILDLRDTPSGGNTSVARGILGRFVAAEKPYQKHLLPSEERETGVRRSWLELVTSREPIWRRPVAVLVGRWTGSMGEGLAIGFDGTGAGTVVGTPMARLRGATYRFELPHSGIGVNIPAEKLFHVNGTPREAFVPPVPVNPADSEGPDRDPWIEKALSVLR
jgi:carboxyl-terminal processing protease